MSSEKVSKGRDTSTEDDSDDDLSADLEFEYDWPKRECELHKYMCCQKNPNHDGFLRYRDFSITDIPLGWRSEAMYNAIRRVAARTVLLKVECISSYRPPSKSCDMRGMNVMTTGTGSANIDKKHLTKPEQPCPFFPKCELNSKPHKVTASFQVVTATHVVFDNMEASRTSLDFFFHCDDDYSNGKVVTAQAVRVLQSRLKMDICLIECVSHDLTLFEQVMNPPSFVMPPEEEVVQEEPKTQCSELGEGGTEMDVQLSACDDADTADGSSCRPAQEKIVKGKQVKSKDDANSFQSNNAGNDFHSDTLQNKAPHALHDLITREPQTRPTADVKKKHQHKQQKEQEERHQHLKHKKPRSRYLVVIISHPHGCEKHISFGTVDGVRRTFKQDIPFTRKVRDLLDEMKAYTPRWREAGGMLGGRFFIPPDTIEILEKRVEEEPEYMLDPGQGEAEDTVEVNHYFTVTAATCPGSSGAPVCVCPPGQLGNGQEDVDIRTTNHLKQYDSERNLSGIILKIDLFEELGDMDQVVGQQSHVTLATLKRLRREARLREGELSVDAISRLFVADSSSHSQQHTPVVDLKERKALLRKMVAQFFSGAEH